MNNTNEQLMLECLEAQFKYYVDHIGVENPRAKEIRECLTKVKGYDPIRDHATKQ